ncbi:hypothetical protein BDV59DRAFT_90159 [Aspergillus ambiguus]|uniref:uncharacterized protein n=1 Tax=Aspergillus ambiguus TaxID=176160 RepID=UPI003CCD7798
MNCLHHRRLSSWETQKFIGDNLIAYLLAYKCSSLFSCSWFVPVPSRIFPSASFWTLHVRRCLRILHFCIIWRFGVLPYSLAILPREKCMLRCKVKVPYCAYTLETDVMGGTQ